MIVGRNYTTTGWYVMRPGRWLVTVRDCLFGVRLGVIWRGRVLIAWRYR